MKLCQLFETSGKKYYHATFAKAVDSIMQHGLGGKGSRKRWSFSTGKVCLGGSPESCKKYANDVYDWDYEFGGNEHALLEITGIDESKVKKDPNSSIADTFEYDGIIEPSHIKLIEKF